MNKCSMPLIHLKHISCYSVNWRKTCIVMPTSFRKKYVRKSKHSDRYLLLWYWHYVMSCRFIIGLMSSDTRCTALRCWYPDCHTRLVENGLIVERFRNLSKTNITVGIFLCTRAALGRAWAWHPNNCSREPVEQRRLSPATAWSRGTENEQWKHVGRHGK